MATEEDLAHYIEDYVKFFKNSIENQTSPEEVLEKMIDIRKILKMNVFELRDRVNQEDSYDDPVISDLLSSGADIRQKAIELSDKINKATLERLDLDRQIEELQSKSQ